MFKPIFAHISLTFSHLYRYYFDSSAEAIDPFVPSQTFQPIPVHYWSLIAQRAESLSYASELGLTRVELCTTRKGDQHEFIIISLYHRSTNRTTYFLTERRQSALTQGVSLTEDQQSQFAPDDRVFTPAGGFRAGIDVYVQQTYGPYKVISSFEPSEEISAAQLSVLLDIPGNIDLGRLSYHNDSCWYAESIYGAIKCLSPGRAEEGEKQKSKWSLKSPGKMGNLSLNVILQRYHSDWNALKLKYRGTLSHVSMEKVSTLHKLNVDYR